MKHSETIGRSFGINADAYFESSVHAQGSELEEAGVSSVHALIEIQKCLISAAEQDI